VSASLLIASNRGPVSFEQDESGSLVERRGGGGLVGVADASEAAHAQWVCAALSSADRRAVREGGLPSGVHMLDLDPELFDRAYNKVANATLWFLTHLLFDTSRAPSFDSRAAQDWEAYRSYGAAFATALAAEAAPGAAVLVQDYHLSLTPRQLRALRPDLRIGHFSHTPWAPPEYFALLPDDVARELLLGMLGADAVGFLSARWADAFAGAAWRCSAPTTPAGSCTTRDGAPACASTRSGSTRRDCGPAPPSRTSRAGSPTCASWSVTGSSSCGWTAPS
jgi:trehalose 6-phosphate synthase